MRIDISNIEGTRCYCSEDSAQQLRKLISGYGMNDVHFHGSGDYHYMTLFWLERIREDFALILIDNHPDNQRTAFGELLSCGSWVSDAQSLPHCKAVNWIDGHGAEHGELPDGLPIYLSVDLDALSPLYMKTNWDQGSLGLEDLKRIISSLLKGRRLLGADICGDLQDCCGALTCDIEMNRMALSETESTIRQFLSTSR